MIGRKSLGALSIVFLLQLALLGRSMRELAAFPFVDDTFYSWGIARHLAAGDGPTFDGTTLTNGFQPLHVLLLVPIYRLGGASPTLALVTLVLVLSWFATFGVFRLCRAVAGRDAALCATALWITSPLVLSQMLNGLETALVTGLTCFAFLDYDARVRDECPLRPATAIRFAVLLGLAILARIDAAALAVALGIAYLYRHRARFAEACASLASVALVVALVAGPWFAFSWLRWGTPLPNSGEAVRFLSLLAGRLAMHLPIRLPDPDLPLAYYMTNVRIALAALGTMLPWNPTLGPPWETMTWIGAGLATAVAAATLVSRRDPWPRLSPLLLHALLMLLAYCGFIFGQWYYPRYLAPLSPILAAAGAIVVDASPAKRVRSAAALVALGLAIVCSISALRGEEARAHRLTRFDAALWVGRTLPETAVVGAFQAGTLGYFAPRKVVNLDGVVNSDALRALKTQTLERYLGEQGIDILVDGRWQLRNVVCQDGYPLLDVARWKIVPKAPRAALRRVREGEEGDAASLCGGPTP